MKKEDIYTLKKLLESNIDTFNESEKANIKQCISELESLSNKKEWLSEDLTEKTLNIILYIIKVFDWIESFIRD